MKILFVFRGAGYFPYQQTTIERLIGRGHDVTLLFASTPTAPDDLGFQAWFTDHRHQVSVGDALRRQGVWRHVLFATREIRSYASYCQRTPDARFYRDRWRQYMPTWVKALAERWPRIEAVFRLRATHAMLAAIERVAPPVSEIVAALRRLKPDGVVVTPTNLRFDEEIEYVKAANALGIPTIVPVLSWDNLTTKGIFHVQPGLVLAWHRGHQEEAETLHQVPADRIVITGSPFFDKWFDARPISPRAATCARIGIDPETPYVLYLGSSANIARNESWLVIKLSRALQEAEGAALRRLRVVFKPHPANLRPLPRLDAAHVPVWPRTPGRPDTVAAVNEFRDVLHHAAAVIGLNTTGMLDALLCDRPCLALTVDRYRQTQIDTAHFQRMRESKALTIAGSTRQAVRTLQRIVAGADDAAAARRRFASTFARPRSLDASAGEAAAIAIELAAAGLSGPAITAAIDRELAERSAPARPPMALEPDTVSRPATAADHVGGSPQQRHLREA